MSDILVELEKGTGDQSLSLVIPLPDSVHVSESLKAGFANWYLKLENERVNLAIFKTLRNNASLEVRKTMRKLLPRNDHVPNKDRQDPAGVIRLIKTYRVPPAAGLRKPHSYPKNGSLY